MSALLEGFRRHLTSKIRALRTIRTYTSIVEAFFAFLERPSDGGGAVTRVEIERFLGRGRQDGGPRAPATRNQELATLRVFFTFAQGEQMVATDPTRDIPFVREPRRVAPVLSVDELQRCFRALALREEACERAANLAILAVLSQTGLRVHELVGLDLDQVDLNGAALLDIAGKGGTVRELPLNDRALSLVAAWIAERPSLAAEGERALFVSERGTRLSVRTVERRIKALRESLALSKKATPHTFRHTFATLELQAGTDLATLAEMLGHSDINTTARYLHWIDTRRREAVRKLAFTVPPDVLPAVSSPGDSFQKVETPPLLEDSQEAVSTPPIQLDDQDGFGADSPLKQALRTTSDPLDARPQPGARFVSEPRGLNTPAVELHTEESPTRRAVGRSPCTASCSSPSPSCSSPRDAAATLRPPSRTRATTWLPTCSLPSTHLGPTVNRPTAPSPSTPPPQTTSPAPTMSPQSPPRPMSRRCPTRPSAARATPSAPATPMAPSATLRAVAACSARPSPTAALRVNTASPG